MKEAIYDGRNTLESNIHIRVYEPIRSRNGDGTLHNVPMALWFHGGGFVIGTHHGEWCIHHMKIDSCTSFNQQAPVLLHTQIITSDDWKCTMLSNITGAVVVSVAYSLAPENRYPRGRLDCEVGRQYISCNINLGIILLIHHIHLKVLKWVSTNPTLLQTISVDMESVFLFLLPAL